MFVLINVHTSENGKHTDIILIDIQKAFDSLNHKIEIVLNHEFVNVCKWFVDNKLSNLFGEDKTKYMFFSKRENNLVFI